MEAMSATPLFHTLSEPGTDGCLPPIVSFVGYSGSGKTTFIEKLIPVLKGHGLKIAVVKHDAHGFQMDKPGKDTWRHKRAGASATAIISKKQIGVVMDVDREPLPHELAPMFAFADIIITEGFKTGPYPKVEVFRPEATENKLPVCREDPALLAIVSDCETSVPVKRFKGNDVDAVALFLIDHFELRISPETPL
jgi:molybdopterin-guanine dinucleotide biosynthesis adapter protein